LGTEKRLPAAPDARAERAEARQRWRRRTLRERLATALAERDAHAKTGASALRDFLGSRLRIPLPAKQDAAPRQHL
jgi:hypothetical protein